MVLINVSVMLTRDSPVKLSDRHEWSELMADKKARFRAKLTDETIRKIWTRLRTGHNQHDIAADLGVNQGRISEVNTGKRGGHITGRRAA